MFTEEQYEELLALRKISKPTKEEAAALATLEEAFEEASAAAARSNAYATRAARKLDAGPTAFVGAIPVVSLPTTDVVGKVTGKTDDGKGYWVSAEGKSFIVSGGAIDKTGVAIGGRIVIACARLLKGKKYSWTNGAGSVVAETMNADALRGIGFPQSYTIEDLKFDIELARKSALERSSAAQNANA